MIAKSYKRLTCKGLEVEELDFWRIVGLSYISNWRWMRHGSDAGSASLPYATQEVLTNPLCNRFHQQRRHAISYPCPPCVVAALELESFRIGSQCLDLLDGQPPYLVGMNQSRGCAAGCLHNGRRRSLRIQADQSEMFVFFLFCQDALHLLGRFDLGFFQLVAGAGLADRRGRLIRGDPGIDPLGPRRNRARDHRLHGNGLKERFRVNVQAISSRHEPKPALSLPCDRQLRASRVAARCSQSAFCKSLAPAANKNPQGNSRSAPSH